MSAKFKFEIVTMDALIYSQDDIESVVIPGVEGYLGVLADHMPYITQVSTGTVSVKKSAAAEKNDAEWHITSGFAKIIDNTVTLFADKIEQIQAE
ncbi:MAG: ATP synthase F1 subunit epsilon [Candidatus Wallbacteria bacterium]